MSSVMRWFLSCLLAASFTAFAHSEQRIALIVANTDYETPGWSLTTPARDAELIRSALETIGFEVFVVLDADREQMETAFRDHGERLRAAGADSTGFFFFAGHGVQSEGLNYLLPVDAEIYSEADVWAHAPRLENLFRHLRRSNSARNFVVMDACRNNPLQSSFRNIARGLANEGRANGTLIAFSTSPGMVADDGTSNSPYAKTLAELIVQPGVPVESLFRRVRTRVSAMTNNRQRPWIESGLEGEADFCFAGCLDVDEQVSSLVSAIVSGDTPYIQKFIAENPQHRLIGLATRSLNNNGQNSATVSGGISDGRIIPEDEIMEESLWAHTEGLGFPGWLLYLRVYPEGKYASDALKLLGDVLKEDDATQFNPTEPIPDTIAYKGHDEIWAEAYRGEFESFNALMEWMCSGGSGSGCYYIGMSHKYGRGIPANENTAAEYFEKACDLDSFSACEELGLLLYSSVSVASDHERSRFLLNRACDAGKAESCSTLGAFFLYGIGGNTDMKEALQLFERSCAQGSSSGCFNLGMSYSVGDGIQQDPEKANTYYTMSCNNDNAQACFELGLNLKAGIGAQRDLDGALLKLRKACELGFDDACSQFGIGAE